MRWRLAYGLASGGGGRRGLGGLRLVQLAFWEHSLHHRFSHVDFSTAVTWSFWI